MDKMEVSDVSDKHSVGVAREVQAGSLSKGRTVLIGCRSPTSTAVQQPLRHVEPKRAGPLVRANRSPSPWSVLRTASQVLRTGLRS